VFKYDFARGTVDWDETGFALIGKYPNALDASYAEKRSRDYPEPISVRFCRVCQRRFDAESQMLRRAKASNQAMQRTAGRSAF
jgi:hypothetical protein